MYNIKESKKDNFYLFFLKDTTFKIVKDYDMLNTVSENVGRQLFNKGQYEVQSKVTNENFGLFLDYWTDNSNPKKSPNIDHNNIYDFYQLSKEFGIMEEIISQPKFKQKLEYSLLRSLLINQGDNSEAIIYVSKNLDNYIKNYPKTMYKLSSNCLHSIFFNEQRILINHEKAYKFIIECTDHPDIYILLGSIDGFKLSTKSFLESISKRDDHCGYFPNIRPQDVDLIISAFPNEISSFDGTLKQLIESRLSHPIKDNKYIIQKTTPINFFRVCYFCFSLFATILMLFEHLFIPIGIYYNYYHDKYLEKYNIYSQEKEEAGFNYDNDPIEINTENLINEVIRQLEIQIKALNNKNIAKLLIKIKNNIANGNTESLFNCGILFERGNYVKKNTTVAACIYKYLADLGNVNAMEKYAFCREKGIGCNVNITESAIYLERAANNGHLSAIYRYALNLYEGTLGQTNKIVAAYYFKMGADQSCLKCIKRYADMLFNGDGIKANKEDAAHYFKLGSDKGDLSSTLKYIKYLKTKKIDVDNIQEIANYTKRASDFGDLDSMCDFALMLLNGYGVEINEKSSQFNEKAADKGHTYAKIKYGLMLFKGIGVDADEDKSIYYIKSIGHEDAGALYYMDCIKEHLSFDEFIDIELKLECFDDIVFSFVPFSLGIELINDKMLNLIPKNSHIPIKASDFVTTVVDNQTTAKIKIYAGENTKASKNIYLGSFELKDIPPAPKGVPLIEVTFEVGTDGTVHVSALNKSTGNYEKTSFKLPIRNRFFKNDAN